MDQPQHNTSRIDRARIEIIKTIYHAIEQTGEMGMPSGHLYARLMDVMTLDQYNSLIDGMIEAGLITRSNHLLKAKLDKKT